MLRASSNNAPILNSGYASLDRSLTLNGEGVPKVRGRNTSWARLTGVAGVTNLITENAVIAQRRL